MIRTMHRLAATVRGRRITLGRTQAEIAVQAHVSRAWLIDLEAGKLPLDVGRVFRVLRVLGLALEPVEAPTTPSLVEQIVAAHKL